MSLFLSIAFAASASAVTLPSCSWDRPGRNAFVGDVVAAVDRYADIPPAVRATLKRRMASRQYDEIATIERDAITGQFRYAPEIREMHFGTGQVCNAVTRSEWSSTTRERGLVYCEGEHCIIVPTVCRNVARVTRLTDRRAGEGGRRDPAQPVTPSGSTAEPAVLVEALPGAGAGPAAAGFERLAGPAGGPAEAAGPALASAPGGTAGEPPAAPGSLAARVASDVVEPLVVASAAGPSSDPADPGPATGGGEGFFPPVFGPVSGSPSAPSPGALPAGPAVGELPLTPIPEPGSAAMWLAGLAVLGWLLRRRR